MPIELSKSSQSRELTFALDVCAKAGEIAMDHLKKGVRSEMKCDDSPVTAADKECERLIRQRLAEVFPEDAILGEEEGESAGATPGNGATGNGRKWIIDPIDGTYNYARGVPIFATLLALEHDGEIVLGVVHAPAMGDTYWAEQRCGAYKNGDAIKASTCSDLSRSQFNFGALDRIQKDGYWDGFGRLVSATYRQRGYGDYLGFAYVFEDKAESMLEVGVKVWDLAPMKILIKEAGGRYSDLSGGDSVYTGSCLVSNAPLHEQILDLLLGR